MLRPLLRIHSPHACLSPRERVSFVPLTRLALRVLLLRHALLVHDSCSPCVAAFVFSAACFCFLASLRVWRDRHHASLCVCVQ